jgi:hypothetical protein
MDFKKFDDGQATMIGTQSSAVTGPMVAKIDDCKVYDQDDRIYAEFTLTPIDGRKTLRFVKIQLQKEDGTPGFGFPQWNSIRGLLQLTTEDSLRTRIVEEDIINQKKEVTYIDGMAGKTLGFLMQRNNWGVDEAGEYYKYSMNIILPFDPGTKQTYSEKKNGQKPIKMEQRAANLTTKTTAGLPTPTRYASNSAGTSTELNDLPSW